MSNIPRFYETNITVGYSPNGNTIISPAIFNTMIDPVSATVSNTITCPAPPPSTICPAPPPATRCPAPPPPTRCPAPPPPPRCPAAAPPCPTITKLKVISASMNSNDQQQLVIEKPNGWTRYTNRNDFVANNINIAVVSTLPVPSGGTRGGQFSSDYTFRPEIFDMNSDNKISTDRKPVYFDYYTFFTLKNTNIINRTTTNSSGFINGSLTNSLFILDKNNIPHYLSAVISGSSVLYYSINKKIANSYMSYYDPIKIDFNKRLFVDIRLNNKINTTITISDITLMPIPISLKIPNILYAKTSSSPPLATPRVAPIVEPPPVPAPRPAPRPVPVPVPVPA